LNTLVLKNITKRYGDDIAVNNFNAEIHQNELITIVGPSGCGKTTTLRMIAGFIDPTEGQITLDGVDLVNKEKNVYTEPEKRGIGMVFQSYAVWPHMNVFKNVSYPLKLRKVNKEEMTRRTREVLRLVHLEKYENSFVHELSGGQQQRVALARALVMEPRLLLLDEPLSNLDAALRETMRSEIKEIQRKTGITIINVTHDQIEAMTMSDRVIIMSKGNIVQVGSPEEIYNNPVNSFVANFIGSSNVIKATVVKLDGEVMTVKLLGHEIQLPKGKQVLNQDGFVSVRPHHVLIDPSSPMKGKVIRKLYMGDRVEYHLDFNGEEVRMITDAENKLNIDDIIGVQIKYGLWLDE